MQNNNPISQVLGENGSGIPAVVVGLGTGMPRKVAATAAPPENPHSLHHAELEDLESPWFSWPIVSQL